VDDPLRLAGTADMREVVARSASGDAGARLGLEVYLHGSRAGIAPMSAAAGTTDVLVFTDGVGENSPVIRASAAARLELVGVQIDTELNVGETADCEVTHAGGVAKTLVIHAREDLEIVHQLLRAGCAVGARFRTIDSDRARSACRRVSSGERRGSLE
jgi:acetate kinase